MRYLCDVDPATSQVTRGPYPEPRTWPAISGPPTPEQLLAMGIRPSNYGDLQPAPEERIDTDNPTVYPDRVEYRLVPLPAEELQARVQAQIDAIRQASRAYVDERLHPAGMMLVDRLVRRDPPNAKAQAVEIWVNDLYTESYRRMALIEAGLWPDDEDPADFSVCGDKPFTIPQLMAEV